MTEYLFRMMPLLSQLGDTKSAIKGATLNSDSISALMIPLPPLAEQERIIAKLAEVKEGKYTASLKPFKEDILLVGINYNAKSGKHTCEIIRQKE